MNYNRKRYLYLLQYSQDLENEGKFLLDENREAFSELLKYDLQVVSHFSWQNRRHFFSVIKDSVIKDFIDETIDVEDFIEDLFYISEKSDSVYEEFRLDFRNVENFEPDSRSKGFNNFIIEILSDCHFFETYEEDEQEKRELNKKLLKNSVQDAFLEMQKYL